MMGRTTLVAVGAGLFVAACGQTDDTATNADKDTANERQIAEVVADELTPNPLLDDFEAPFGVPPFENIDERHYRPAFDEGLSQHKIEIANIADTAQEPTFANTIESLERSGQLLADISRVFFALASANTNDKIQAIQREISPILSNHNTEIFLDDALFKRVKKIYDEREYLDLDANQRRLVERYYLDFVRAGAELDAVSKTRLAQINSETSSQTVAFGQNLLKENQDFELVLESEEELAGLPGFVRTAAAQTAKERDKDGKYVFVLNRSSMTPFLTFSTRRDLREKIHKGWTERGNHANASDNRASITKIAALRAERAKLLGYESHAQYVLEDRMAKSPSRVYELLDQIWKPAIERAKEERAELQAMADAEGGDFKIAPWDWWHYAEKVRKAKYDIDEETLKPYFQLDNMIGAAFHVAGELFGVTFKERKDLPVYHPDVRTWEISGRDGEHVGVFFGDYFSRAPKRGGAWMSAFRSQQRLDGNVRPIIFNVCNFSKGAQGEPSLLSFSDANTLFHEFGHALHGLLSQVRYPYFAGTSVPRDFVEFPAQIYEHWINQPEVLKKYAVHYKTGEPIPDGLLQKVLKASKFNQGFATVEYLSASYLDMAWHSLDAEAQIDDVNKFENEVLAKLGLIPEIVVRYRSPYFAHVFAGGYSAGYYSYIWSEVLDADGFNAFKEAGHIFDNATAKRLYDHVYSAGGTEEAMDLYVKFRGQEPSVEPLLENRGLLLN